MGKRWKEMEENSLLTGVALTPLVEEVNGNVKALDSQIRLIEKVRETLSVVKYSLVDIEDEYARAKTNLNEEALRRLNSEMILIKKAMDDNFDTTLNGLIMEEGETEKESEERIKKRFTLPLKK